MHNNAFPLAPPASWRLACLALVLAVSACGGGSGGGAGTGAGSGGPPVSTAPDSPGTTPPTSPAPDDKAVIRCAP